MGNLCRSNRLSAVFVAVGCLLYASAHGLSLHMLMGGPAARAFADGAVTSLVLAGEGVLLWYAFRFGGWSGIPRLRRFAGHAVCALIYAVSGAGIVYALMSVACGGGCDAVFVRSLPFRVMTSLMLYALLSLVFALLRCRGEGGRSMPAEPIAEPPAAEPAVTPAVETIDRIAVKTGSRLELIPVCDVVSITAEGDYVSIRTVAGKYLKEQTMKWFEERLPRADFMRVHRSAIVNIGMISSVELYEKQRWTLVMRDGGRVGCSQEGYRSLRARLGI